MKLGSTPVFGCHSQSAGMFFQSGTDGKPLHAGLATPQWCNGLTNCYNIHHFKTEYKTVLTLNGVGLKPSVILPLHQMSIASRWLLFDNLLIWFVDERIHPYCSAILWR